MVLLSTGMVLIYIFIKIKKNKYIEQIKYLLKLQTTMFTICLNKMLFSMYQIYLYIQR